MRLFRRYRRLFALAACALMLMSAFVAFANYRILSRHREQIYGELATLPTRPVALVLGTSPRTAGGRPNLHFAYRIDAAAALYHAGKVRHLLVSGDNHVADYDEPSAMKAALMERGVPAEAITCDYAGFRTLDSVVRAKTVFGLEAFTILSQRYHNGRALEIARAHGIDAVAFCTREVPTIHAVRTEIREVLARAATLIDLYLLHRRPHFTGPFEPLRLAHR